MTHIVLVDDQRLVRHCLKARLEAVADFSVVGEAASGEEARSIVQQNPCDLVLMDLHMPGIGGLEATRRLLAFEPELRIVGLSMYVGGPYPRKFMELGGAGHASKNADTAEHIEAIRPLLPEKYSPLSVKGLGQQNLYLTRLSPRLGMLLEGLAGPNLGVQLLDADRTNEPWTDEAPAALYEWEEQIEKQIATASSLSETERHRLISARMGQGLFRQRVLERERRCRITGVERQIHLVASHCKPWRVANNDERLDGENGLALTPSIDHLFDKGFISFEDNGRLLISPVADQSALARMGVPTGNSFSAGVFSHGQKRYLDYHREMIFKESRVVG